MLESAFGPTERAVFGRQLGTAGGGNHFLEFAAVDTIVDRPAADALGLSRSSFVALAHSGSRGFGGAIAQRWRGRELSGPDIEASLGELNAACRFARTNRLIMVWRLLGALGVARRSKLAAVVDSAARMHSTGSEIDFGVLDGGRLLPLTDRRGRLNNRVLSHQPSGSWRDFPAVISGHEHASTSGV
jgi:hypothetical protein